MENTTDLDTFYCGPRQCPDAVIGRIEPAGARRKKRLTLAGTGADRAFNGCPELEKLDFRPVKVLYHIHDLAFLDCSSIKAVLCREDQAAMLRRHFRPEVLVIS